MRFSRWSLFVRACERIWRSTGGERGCGPDHDHGAADRGGSVGFRDVRTAGSDSGSAVASHRRLPAARILADRHGEPSSRIRTSYGRSARARTGGKPECDGGELDGEGRLRRILPGPIVEFSALDLYRASASGCGNQDLSKVNAWDYRDGEVYLYQQGGAVAARLRGSSGALNGVLAKSGAPLTLAR